MTEIVLPKSVRYVKNGRGGQWWQAARANNQIHLGWKSVPHELLRTPDFPKIKQLLKAEFGSRQGATQDFNALCDLLDAPSKHIWMTFQDGCMWWCTAIDGAIINPDGESFEKGNFWLACNRPWSNRSLKGRLLAISDLPGSVTRTAGFKATVCTPKAWQAVLRIIRDERDPDATSAANARSDYQQAVLRMVKRLSPKDFEQLIDHILTRSGWARISTLGKTREGIDIEAENLAVGEIAFVQVKGSANQQVLNDYIERFQQRRGIYARMIFAVHSPTGKLTAPNDHAVQVWTGDRLAQLVVRLGLGEWVETRLA
ncbi:MAG: restriction endonuclease [Euryarchaeota archaeon]|nr:restriction endonuclease [Euryarchaeota archaeon]